MMRNTKKYGFILPEDEDGVDIEEIDSNFEKIDETMPLPSNVLGTEFRVSTSQQLMTDLLVAAGLVRHLNYSIKATPATQYVNLITGAAVTTSLTQYASMEVTFVALESATSFPDTYLTGSNEPYCDINGSPAILIGYTDYVPLSETDGVVTDLINSRFPDRWCRTYRYIIRPGMTPVDRISSMACKWDNMINYNKYQQIEFDGFIPLSSAIKTSSLISSYEDVKVSEESAINISTPNRSKARAISAEAAPDVEEYAYVISIESNKVNGEFVQDCFCNINGEPVKCIGNYDDGETMTYDFQYQGEPIEQILFNTFTPNKDDYTFNVKVFKMEI